MADLTYSVDINTNPAMQAMDKLNRSIDNLTKKLNSVQTKSFDNLKKKAEETTDVFGKLQGVIAGLAIGAATTNAIAYADALSDLSTASGIAIQELMGLSEAYILSGGDAEKARVSVLKFLETIDEAAKGSQKTQAAFKEVQVSLDDLRMLSERDLLRKTIEGLAEIEDPARRASLAVELLGKGAKGIDFTNVAASVDRLTEANERNAKAAQKAAEFQDKLDRTTIQLRNSILSAIEPLLDFVNNLDPEKTNKLVNSFVQMSAALVAIAAAFKTFEYIGKALAYIAGTVTLVGVGFASIATTVSKTGESLSQWWRQTPRFAELGGRVASLGKVLGELASRFKYLVAGLGILSKGFLGWLGVIWLVNDAIDALTGKGLVGWAKEAGNALVGLYDKITGKKQEVVDPAKMALPPGVKPNETAGAGRGDGGYELKMRRQMLEQQKREVKDASDFEKKLAEMNANVAKNLALRNADDIKAIRIKSAAEIAAYNTQIDEDVADKKYSREQAERLKSAKAAEINSAAENEIAKIVKGRTDDLSRFTQELKDQTKEYGSQLNELTKRYQFETSLIGLTEDEVEQRKALNDLANEYTNKLKDIETQIAKLNLEQQLDPSNAQIKDKIKLLEEQKIALTNFYDKTKAELPKYITDLQTSKLLEEDRKRTLENITKAIEAQIQRQQTLGDLLVSANDKLKETQFQGAQQKRNPLEQQMANIQEEARKAALEAGRAFAASFEGMDLTSEQAQELANGLSLIAERYQLIAQEQTKQLEYSRSWEAGWKDAFDKYMDNATNAAMRAGEVFGSITRNMESAIDRFVETGKFSFKDFARSIIQDLIKIELKAQATQLLKAIGGSGSIFSAIGSLFGFANGGNPPINKPSIVGENGPELFVPKSAGTIIPNGATQGIMNGIGMGAVQAPVTNNYITNNISALDAKSVAQLFAENRKTLLGTVEMARKEMPYYNR